MRFCVVGRVGNGVSRFLEVFHLLVRRFAAAFPRRERHAHRRRRVGARALRHHVGDGPRDFLMCAAGDKFDLCGVNAPVQDAHLAVFKPREKLFVVLLPSVYYRKM